MLETKYDYAAFASLYNKVKGSCEKMMLFRVFYPNQYMQESQPWNESVNIMMKLLLFEMFWIMKLIQISTNQKNALCEIQILRPIT